MPKERNPGRDEAFSIYKRSHGKKKLSDIAAKIGVSPSTLRKWKSVDKWDERISGASAPNRRGAQRGNRNACGAHKVDQAGNQRATTHGAYSRLLMKYMQPEEREVFTDTGTGEKPLDDLKQELRILGVQELRLMARLAEVRSALERKRGGITPDMNERAMSAALMLIQAQTNEIYTLESALDRCTARRIAILKLLHEADVTDDGSVSVIFGNITSPPGMPDEESMEPSVSESRKTD